MKFEQLYSSSKANLYVVTAANGRRLLVECGIAWPKLQKALKFNLEGIEACILSHEHKDHSAAIYDIMRAGIDVYASNGTFEARIMFYEENRRVKAIANKTLVRLDSFEIYAFEIQHDADEPLGFVIREKATNESLLFCTDTSFIKQRFPYQFSIIAIECSYDKDILQKRVDENDINEELAKRLLTSHMEKSQATRYIAEFCDLGKCSEIHLLHMSKDNIDRAKTKIEFEKRFFLKVIIKN